ncbi:aminotransferase class I/II-fold pyridoxal phosphate-dependent enzyme [Terasakiella pusilla]|uniref:aminotransferase class I/II-fold pyridoxal phosphate-dependent enzyme n=1 Tax=Terasakiella pusilla TaxID=64973 RepID=UPI003AA90685
MSQESGATADPSEAKRRLLAELLNKKKTVSKPDVPSITQQMEKPSLEEGAQQLSDQFAWLEGMGQANPYFRTLEGIPTPVIYSEGREIINYANYNYLGLCGDQRVTDAAKNALDKYGTSVSASRIASGERTLHQRLESQVANLIGQEDALALVGGFTTNASVIGHICGPQDLIIYDSYIHRSALEGACLAGSRSIPFPHNNLVALEDLLSEHRQKYRQCLVIVEGLYSMDGDIVDLPKVIELKSRFNALLFVDEAHSLGVLGASGRGITEHFNVNPKEIDLWMGTFSKTLASCGGAIAGRHEIIRYLRYSTPGFVYSVGLSPANAAATLTAITLMLKEPERVKRLQHNSQLFWNLCREAGLNTGPCEGYAVVPVIVGSPEKSIAISNALFEKGINVQPIFYPAVAKNEARIRFFITSEHTEEQIYSTISSLTDCIGNTD